MKRLLVLSVVCALTLLVAGPAAAAPRYHPAAGLPAAGMGAAQDQLASGRAAQPQFAPLSVAAAGSATVSGMVYDSDHVAAADVSVMWQSTSDGVAWSGGWGSTDASGAYSLTVTPGASCWIYAYPGNGDPYLGRGGSVWEDGGSYTGQDLYPGRISVTAHRGGPWGDFGQVWVFSWYDTRDCRGIVYASDAITTPVQGLIDMLDGTYTEGFATFFWDEGVEFHGSWDVASGSTHATGLTVDEADAQRVWLTAPYWYSGKPGAKVKLALSNFPEGWINRIGGRTDDPAATVDKIYGEYTSSGTATKVMTFTIPATAKPGYSYWFTIDHLNDQGSLYLNECYQVCTLKSSKTAIRKGGRIKLSGVVPTEGHWGSQAGETKYVTIYKRTKSATAAPTAWDATKKGWTRVARVKANGYGGYSKTGLKVSRTTWYVVRYPGDDWYYDGYTSVLKVRAY